MVDRMRRADPAVGSVFAGSWINVVLGIAVVSVPFFTIETEAAFWSNIVTGIAVAALAAYNAWAAARADAAPSGWISGLNVLLGIWLVVSPFVFLAGVGYVWTNILLGIVVALVAGYNAWAASTAREHAPMRRAGI